MTIFTSPHFNTTGLIRIVTVLSLAFMLVTRVTAEDDCTSPPNQLAGWWAGEMNGDDFVAGNSGLISGDVTFAPGKVGESFHFGGVAGAVVIPAATDLAFESVTIEGWIKPVDGITPRPIVEYANATGPCSMNFWYNTTGNAIGSPGALTALFRDAGGTVWLDFASPGGLLQVDQWNHVAVSFDSSTGVGKLYHNGVLVGVKTSSAPIRVKSLVSVNLGSRPAGSADLWAGRCHAGSLDELSIYKRALSDEEIESIHTAGSWGKCSSLTAPVLLVQPVNQSVFKGTDVRFRVVASGTSPLSYQWRLNGADISGEMGDTLILRAVQETNAGNYSVVVSNTMGSATSSNALLTVLSSPPCSPAATGLVGWWRGDGDAADQVSGKEGSLMGETAFGIGRVGQAFTMDGNGDGISLGNPACLHLQDLTIEAWIRRSSTERASYATGGHGAIVSCGWGGYFFWLHGSGYLQFNRLGDYSSLSGPSIADTEFHHVAVTKSGTTVTFYLDGIAYTAPAYSGTFSFTSGVGIGFRPDNKDNSFLGTIDEVSVYNRALTANEIQAVYTVGNGGKCVADYPAFVVTQPSDQTVTSGSDVSFTVVPGGTPPFDYQWTWNGMRLAGATTSSLTLTNVQFGQAGAYAVTITNSLGFVESSNAVLTVVLPPAALRVVSVSAMGGEQVTVPVEIVANGDENGLQFSLSYNPSLLAYSGVRLGPDLLDATLVVNTNQSAAGQLGCIVALPTEATLKAGTQQIILVTFSTPVRWSSVNALVTFGDTPTTRQLVDAHAQTLSAKYSNGAVTLSASSLEADVNPRPNGDRFVTVSDWVLLGRYAARLDYPTNATEFQRADCAPRITSGDGQIRVTDWIQVGRYASEADPLTIIGGPTTEQPELGMGPSIILDDSERSLRLMGGNWFSGQTGVVSVVLRAQGDESALGFSVTFDPARFAFMQASKGSSGSSTTLNLNTAQIGEGRLGVALALISGTFSAGDHELVRLFLRAIPNTTPNSTVVAFTDAPVPREVSSATALPLLSGYESGLISINPFPALQIAIDGNNVILTWPEWANGFILQASPRLETGNWTIIPTTPILTGHQFSVALPADTSPAFYRLVQP